MIAFQTIGLLLLSNIFMTIAWYGHLKFKDSPLLWVILISWGIAFFEYCLQIPANRIGHTQFTAPQLKIIQEVITFAVFAVFSVVYLKERPTLYDAAAFGLIVLAVGISVFQPSTRI
ncbi:MAG: DMT family protein [Bdellovibrionales bacterium]|nr:DMT family protein [Bdellovibrionales bacterium]